MLRLLRGADAVEAAPLLLAARDTHVADEEEPPDDYRCPISRELMVDPVCTASGEAYEREAIALWFRTQHTDPMTNVALESKKLTPNLTLRRLIGTWLEAHPGYGCG